MGLERQRPVRRRGGRRRHPSRPAPLARGAAAVALAGLLLAGCASPSDQVTDAIDQGIAATATARVTLDLDERDRIFGTTASTAVQDARREAADAARTVAEVDATEESEAGRRAEALDALDEAVRALDSAVDALAGVGGDPAEAADRVAEAEEGLRALTREGSP